jgi:hypothetical protein
LYECLANGEPLNRANHWIELFDRTLGAWHPKDTTRKVESLAFGTSAGATMTASTPALATPKAPIGAFRIKLLGEAI